MCHWKRAATDGNPRLRSLYIERTCRNPPAPTELGRGTGGCLSDATDELEKKRAESNARADEWRAKRDRLNGEARAIADTRGALLDAIHEKSAEAQEHRRHRDALNADVREAKRLREEWNTRLQELGDKVQEMRRSRPPPTGSGAGLAPSQGAQRAGVPPYDHRPHGRPGEAARGRDEAP